MENKWEGCYSLPLAVLQGCAGEIASLGGINSQGHVQHHADVQGYRKWKRNKFKIALPIFFAVSSANNFATLSSCNWKLLALKPQSISALQLSFYSWLVCRQSWSWFWAIACPCQFWPHGLHEAALIGCSVLDSCQFWLPSHNLMVLIVAFHSPCQF